MALPNMEGGQIKLDLKFQHLLFGHNNLLYLFPMHSSTDIYYRGEYTSLAEVRVCVSLRDEELVNTWTFIIIRTSNYKSENCDNKHFRA